jgi:uncharacterized protein
MGTGGLQEKTDLLDWRRRIFALYREIRDSSEPNQAWTNWRAARDSLFKDHPQSPLSDDGRTEFTGLEYYDYDPAARVLAETSDADPQHYEIPTSGDGPMSFERVGRARFELFGEIRSLELYWLDAYGGGLFVPFRDATSGKETYGAGRYLLDTVKGADLGMEEERLVLDFNFAYNPSCAYDPRWVCPLAPPANRLDIAVPAGERTGRK